MNIYWPVFKNLEAEFSKLMYDIHIDDDQLSVYSSKISDLILRAAIEIESISKELYFQNGGTKTGHIRYDDDALALLINKWSLDEKVVLISSSHCFVSNKTLTPFAQNELRTGKTTKTFSWNNCYQNIKHDRAKSIKFGNIKYLFDILSALYVLNLYYGDKVFQLERDSQGVSFSPNIGSDIFSVVIGTNKGFDDSEGTYEKSENFDKSVYYVNRTEKSNKLFANAVKLFQAKFDELMDKYPKTHEYINKIGESNLKEGWQYEALGREDYLKVLTETQRVSPLRWELLRYEARLNKNEHSFLKAPF